MINTAFVNTLSGRLIVFGVLPTMLAIGAIVAVSAVDNQRTFRRDEERLLDQCASGAATELNFRNERWNNVATVIALSQINGGFGQRQVSCEFVKDVSTTFPLIIGAYIVYEPNADGQDAAALKDGDIPREAMDASGRFVPHWNTKSGISSLQQRTGMESRQSYQGPKNEFAKSGKSIGIVTEPDLRQDVMVVTHAFPIVIKGKFAGCAGVDRDLAALQGIAEGIKSKFGADVFVLSAGDRFLAATTDAQKAAGADRLVMQELATSPYRSEAGRWRSVKEKGQVFEAIDPVLGEACVYATSTVSTGGWNVVIRRTKADVMQAANAALLRNITIGGVGLMVVGGLLFGVSRSVSQRIRRAGIRLYSTATEISATSKQQEASASTFGAASSQIAAAVKEISATGKDLVRTMESVSENAAETAELAAPGAPACRGWSP